MMTTKKAYQWLTQDRIQKVLKYNMSSTTCEAINVILESVKENVDKEAT